MSKSSNSKKLCVHCGESKDNTITRSDYWSLISESGLLLEIYDKVEDGMDGFMMGEKDRICWDCVYGDVIEYLCDGIDVEKEIEIRKAD